MAIDQSSVNSTAKDDKEKLVAVTALILMSLGGVLAWGFGGTLFAMGLWLCFALIADYIGKRPR